MFGMTKAVLRAICEIRVQSFVIQSEAKNLFPFLRGIPHGVRNDKGGYLRSFAPFAKFAFG